MVEYALMHQYSYGWEKLHSAVLSLTGEHTQKERLNQAVAFSLAQINPENDLPPELREEFVQFLERRPNSKDLASDDPRIGQAIGKIVHFYGSICRHMPVLE